MTKQNNVKWRKNGLSYHVWTNFETQTIKL